MNSRAERRFESMTYAVPREDDSAQMKEALAQLLHLHSEVKRPENNAHQLKLSPSLSYYPTKKSVFVDGEPKARSRCDIDTVIALLIERDEHFPPTD